MKRLTGQVLLAACLLLLVLAVLPTAHAFDDSIDTNTGQSATVNSQQLGSTLTKLAQQSNDTKLQQLVSQFNSSLASGNGNLTASNLAALQKYLAQTNNTSLLNSLVQSLKPAGNGVTIDPTKISSLLNVGSNGLPNGLSGNASQQIGDLTSLANLLKNVNPNLAQQLLNSASNISLKSGVPSSLSGSLGSLGSLNGLRTPSISTPKLGGSGSPIALLRELLIPIVIVAAALTLFAFRGRFSGLMRGQRVPGVVDEKPEPLEYDPSDPKKRIIYYFLKSIQFMKRRGVPKSGAETHREFSAKCVGNPGSQHVSAISNLYEKAKFSGQMVSNDDANSAEKELSNLETPIEEKSK